MSLLKLTLFQISEKTVKVATEMSLAHNIMVRNLNSIYLQAENIKEPKDITDFMIFCQTTYETIHHHHSLEEEYLFPWIEEYTGEKGIMEANLEQHKAFEAGAEKFKEYILGTGPESYDGKELKRVIDGFGPALTVHLEAEIQTLLGLDRFGAEKLEAVWKKLDKVAFDTIEDKVCFRSCLTGNWGRRRLTDGSIAFYRLGWVQMISRSREGRIRTGHRFHGLCRILLSMCMRGSMRELGDFVLVRFSGSRGSCLL
jgi:hemerythrin-like domain-containing protein